MKDDSSKTHFTVLEINLLKIICSTFPSLHFFAAKMLEIFFFHYAKCESEKFTYALIHITYFEISIILLAFVQNIVFHRL